mgnify:CR=1 FL=1
MIVAEPWNYLIVTASNESQATAYKAQLDVRRRLELLGDVREVIVVADPAGRRVGSGGSTICCLLEVLGRELADAHADPARPGVWDDLLRQLRILIVHAGGDSRRLPAYGPCGKVFVPLPGRSDSALGATLFDRQLSTYLKLPPPEDGSGQVVITSGDVLLDFAPEEVTFASCGITGVGCSAAPELASKHGVYCIGPGGQVRKFLQKPSPATQADEGAVDGYGQSVLDIGVIHLDAATAVELLKMCDVRPDSGGTLAWHGPMGDAIFAHGLDVYREICCAMGSQCTPEFYRSAVHSSGSHWEKDLLDRIFATVSAAPCRVEVLRHCGFLHFGTTRQIIASGQELVLRDYYISPS